MWCPNCRQDVPALAGESPGVHRCGRCGRPLGEKSAAIVVDEATDGDACQHDPVERPATGDVADILETWSAMDDELRRAAWVLNSGAAGSQRRFDAAHDDRPAEYALPPMEIPAVAQHRPHDTNQPAPAAPNRPLLSFIRWTAICLGTGSFACGLMLLGWSMWTGRPELWSLGVPITMAGQVGLLIGLALALDGLWSVNRTTAQQLSHLDQELHELRSTTARLGTTYNSASQAFYMHMAEGASPNLLLADLKGQLDLLAMRLSRESR